MKDLKKSFIFIVFFYLLITNFVFGQQDIGKTKLGVVKLIIHQGDAVETGAGIIISHYQNVMFILTAYHVIDKADSIFVEFYKPPTLRLPAKRFKKVDREKDLGVIYIQNLRIRSGLEPLLIGDISNLKELDEVIALGHPANFEWDLSRGNFSAMDPSSHLIRFFGTTIDFGNSGGPLLNKNYELIGIVTKKQGQHGFALEINHVIDILKEWRIPTGNLRQGDREISSGGINWWWLGAGGATVAGVVARIFIVSGGGNGGNGNGNGNGFLPKPPDFPPDN